MKCVILAGGKGTRISELSKKIGIKNKVIDIIQKKDIIE